MSDKDFDLKRELTEWFNRDFEDAKPAWRTAYEMGYRKALQLLKANDCLNEKGQQVRRKFLLKL